jgi:hypothetical protein
MSTINERAALKAIIVRLIAEALMEKEKGVLTGEADAEAEDVKEFSAMGAGAVASFSLPLGMSPQTPAEPRLRRAKKKKRTN